MFNKAFYTAEKGNKPQVLHLFSLECLDTVFTTARFVYLENRSVLKMVNKVATEYWIYGDYWDRYGKPKNAIFTPKGGDDLHSLRKAGEPEGFIWAESNLKSHFCFSEFLDCKHVHRYTNLQARLSEQIFV